MYVSILCFRIGNMDAILFALTLEVVLIQMRILGKVLDFG